MGIGLRDLHGLVYDLLCHLLWVRLLLALDVLAEGAEQRHHLPRLLAAGLLGARLEQVDGLARLLCMYDR